MMKPFSPKVIRLLVVASALGLMVGGSVRYSARASEIDLEGLPTLLEAKSLLFGEATTDELYQFSMEYVGGRSSYRVFNVRVVEQGGVAKAFLQVQKTSQDAEVRQFEKAVDPASFAAFWQALRELEVAQLTDLSPYSEHLDQMDEDSVNRDLSKKVPPSLTYRFQFQDGVHDYPNSFEVYAPGSLEDVRYQALKDLTERFVQETFGETFGE